MRQDIQENCASSQDQRRVDQKEDEASKILMQMEYFRCFYCEIDQFLQWHNAWLMYSSTYNCAEHQARFIYCLHSIPSLQILFPLLHVSYCCLLHELLSVINLRCSFPKALKLCAACASQCVAVA